MVANHREGGGEGLLTAEGLRGLIDQGFVCSHQGPEIIITHIEVHHVKLLYMTTNAFSTSQMRQVC